MFRWLAQKTDTRTATTLRRALATARFRSIRFLNHMWAVSRSLRSVRSFLAGTALSNRLRNLRCAQWLLACLAVYSVLPYVAPIPLELSEYPALPFAMRLWTSPLWAALLCPLSCSGVAACSYGMTFTNDGALVSHRVRFTSRQLQQKSFLQFIFARFHYTATRILRRSTQPSLVGTAVVGTTTVPVATSVPAVPLQRRSNSQQLPVVLAGSCCPRGGYSSHPRLRHSACRH